MEEKERKLKLLLYTLYVLHTYKQSEQPTRLELNSLMLNSIGTIKKEVSSKEELINRCENIVKSKIQNQTLSKEEIVAFKIGDIIKTGFSSSIISLKFIFRNKLSKTFISIIENENLKLTINF